MKNLIKKLAKALRPYRVGILTSAGFVAVEALDDAAGVVSYLNRSRPLAKHRPVRYVIQRRGIFGTIHAERWGTLTVDGPVI